MTSYELFDTIIKIAVPLITSYLYFVFRAIRKLDLDNVRLSGDVQRAEDKIDHIEGNYKQSIAYLSDRIEDINSTISEMNRDLKDLLKMTLKRRDD